MSDRRRFSEDVAPDDLSFGTTQPRPTHDVTLEARSFRATQSRFDDDEDIAPDAQPSRNARSSRFDESITPNAQPPRPQASFGGEATFNVPYTNPTLSRFNDDIPLDAQPSSNNLFLRFNDDIAPDVHSSQNTPLRIGSVAASNTQLSGTAKSISNDDIAPNVPIPGIKRLKFDDEVASDVQCPGSSRTTVFESVALGVHTQNGLGITSKDMKGENTSSPLDSATHETHPKPKLAVSFEGTSGPAVRKGSIYELNRQLPRRTGSVALGSPFPGRQDSISLSTTSSSRSADSSAAPSPTSSRSSSIAFASPSSRRKGLTVPLSSTTPIDPNDPLSSKKILYSPKRNFSVSGFGDSSSLMRGTVSGPNPNGVPGRRTSFFRRSDGSPFASRKSFSGFQDYVSRRASRSMSVSGGSTYRSRSRSSSSILYYVRRPKHETLPFLDPDTNPELVQQFMDMAREDADRNQRTKFGTYSFMMCVYIGLVSFLYLALIGWPLWHGIVWHLWKYISVLSHVNDGFLIFLSWGACITYGPLFFCQFEKNVDDPEKRDASETCLIIPAYKAASALPTTIRHALAIFKPEQIFIIANGNSPTPLDNTADVCRLYGVRHYWVPVGSKITAEFIGVVLAKKLFKYVLLTDDDVHLPPNLPLPTHRINEVTACIGYTIQSTGPEGSKGTMIQQVQDLEYKLAGLSKVFQSTFGSATFPHGAIILWDRNVLEKCFWSHPGFHISEDWYFGHTCRSTGHRIQFCSQVFVGTETPPALVIPEKSSRGGYGEMTVYKQRFHRWNFFHMYRLVDDFGYLFFAWRLGWYEIVTKIFVIAEIYDTLLYVLRPFLWPMTLIWDPKLGFAMIGVILAIYSVGSVAFNAIHLKRKNAMVAWNVFPAYFGMKFFMVFCDTASVYYSMVAYAKFFAKRHPRVTQDHKALEAAQKLIQEAEQKAEASNAPPLLKNMSEISTSSVGSSIGLLSPASPASTNTLFEWGDSTPFKKVNKEVVVQTTELQHPYMNPQLGVIDESQETLVIVEKSGEMARASGVEMHPEATLSAPCVLQEKQKVNGWAQMQFPSQALVQ